MSSLLPYELLPYEVYNTYLSISSTSLIHSTNSALRTCFNREAGFFAKTTFASDPFHKFNHTCPSCFDYNNSHATNEERPNGSLPEQMNSFVRKISKCSPRLSLPHFCVVNMFQIYVFNYKKEKNIEQTTSKAALYQEAEKLLFASPPVNADAEFSDNGEGSSDGEESSDSEH